VPRRLLLLNVLLGGVSVACAALIAWQLAAPWPSRVPRAGTAAPAAPAPAVEASRPPATAYNVVALRNVFSPARSEGPATVTGGPAAFGAAKPNLYGVVLRDQNPIAYLEDPLTRRVAGYRIGDAIAGGTLQTIDADRVVIARPEGPIDVKLRDPSKPRAPTAPPVPAPGAVAPGMVPPGQPSIIVPGAPVPPSILAPGRIAPQLPPGAPGTGVGPFGFPGGRPSPSLGRRTPVPPITGAPPAPQQ
jgi:hypothetical protein